MKKHKKNHSIKILISGSRAWDWQTVFNKAMVDVLSEIQYHYPVASKYIEIIHGGCRGTDTMADSFANTFGLKKKVFPADWNNMKTERVSVGTTHGGAQYNKLAGLNRNMEMLKYANTFANDVDGIAKCFLIAFQVNKSRGTQYTLNEALHFKMPTYHFTVEYGIQLKLKTYNWTSILKYVRF